MNYLIQNSHKNKKLFERMVDVWNGSEETKISLTFVSFQEQTKSLTKGTCRRQELKNIADIFMNLFTRPCRSTLRWIKAQSSPGYGPDMCDFFYETGGKEFPYVLLLTRPLLSINDGGASGEPVTLIVVDMVQRQFHTIRAAWPRHAAYITGSQPHH